MRFDFLPEEITKPLNNIEMDKLYQIRLRANFPISIIFENNKYYLSEFGLSENNKKAIVCKHSFINYVIEKITENSIYAFNDKIIKGFLTTQNGIRIGIAGECVFDNNKIITIIGCGGNRDRSKRPIMGVVATDNSDYVIFTSDNPRYENPKKILKDITCKLDKKNYKIIVNRKKAIKG